MTLCGPVQMYFNKNVFNLLNKILVISHILNITGTIFKLAHVPTTTLKINDT